MRTAPVPLNRRLVGRLTFGWVGVRESSVGPPIEDVARVATTYASGRLNSVAKTPQRPWARDGWSGGQGYFWSMALSVLGSLPAMASSGLERLWIGDFPDEPAELVFVAEGEQ